ncbi:MAG: hypothetical protein ACM34K_16930 [Bacillota bacterium]
MKKQKIITYLLIVSITLLLINIVIDIFTKKNPEVPPKTELTAGEIKERFENVVSEFGIEKSWIKQKASSKKAGGSATPAYEIMIPQSLPVAVILNELNILFRDENLKVTSKEVTKNRETVLRILSDKTLMLEADFIPSAELTRHTANLGFIIDDIEKLSDKKVDEILGLPESFALTLTPSEKAEGLKKKILESGKEYVTILSDDIDEVRFKFSADYNDKRLKGSIRNILGAFGDCKLFIVDESSEIYKAAFFKTVNADFTARSLSLIPLHSFVRIKGKDEKDLQSVFRYLCESSNSLGNKVFMIDADNFLELKPVLEAYRKKGYKFVFPSSLKFGLK